mmetsp:Transcript_15572/g.7516  ORF Transcript_15572/g.7516 Transcript_15572/m.7516 type:complete len:81 (-) Transcript_15572:301-543(-)
MELNANEVDIFPHVVCPYNAAHRFQETMYSTHIERCKEKFKVSLVRCCFCTQHIYTDKRRYRYHLPRCLYHKDRQDQDFF